MSKPAPSPTERCVVCHAVKHEGYIDHEWVPFTPKIEMSPVEPCAACGHGAHGNHVCPGCLMGCGSSLPPPVPSPATPCQVYPCPCACHRQGPHVPTDECAEAVGDVRRPLSDYTREELDMLYAETAEEDLQLANDPFGEIAALRAALKKAEEENELLKWEIQNCRKALDATIVLHSAAKARLSEIVKSLAAAVTKEKP